MGPLTYIDGEGRRVTEPAEPLFSFSLPIWVQPPPFLSRLWLRALRNVFECHAYAKKAKRRTLLTANLARAGLVRRRRGRRAGAKPPSEASRGGGG